MPGMAKIARSFFAAAWMLAAAPAKAEALSASEACTLTVNSYAWHLDHPGPDPAITAEQFAALFTPDAILIRPDDAPEPEAFRGREAIARSYMQTTAWSRSIYLTSNIRILRETPKKASGTSYLTVQMHAKSGSMKDVGAVTLVLENRDEYALANGICLFSSRASTIRLISTDGVIQPAEAE